MKSCAPFMLLLALLVSCAEAPKTNAEFSVTIAGLTVTPGGLVVTGKRAEGGAFAKIMTTDSLNLELPNGNWNFLVIMWDGASAFAGTIRCDFKKAVALSGAATKLSFSITNGKCSDSNIIIPNTWSSTNFKPTELHLCRLSVADAITAGACNFTANSLASSQAPIASVRLGIHGGALAGSSFVPDGVKLNDTFCYESTALGSLPTMPAINSDFFMPVVVEGYFKPSCAGAQLFVNMGLGQIGAAWQGSGNNKFFASFPDERICAIADAQGLNNLNDIGRGTTAGHPFGICRLEQLYNWHANFAVTAGYNSGDVYLLRNLNLLPGVKVLNNVVTPNAFSFCGIENGSTFMPLGRKIATCPTPETATWATSSTFTGKLNGLGRSISHFRFRPYDSNFINAGLFASLGGQVHHLKMDNVEVEANDSVGAIAGAISGTGTISNVKLENVMIEAKTSFAGGVAGLATSRTITQAHVNNGVIRGGQNLGGIVGEGGTLTDVSFRGFVVSESSTSSYCGGIAGESDGVITRAISSGLVQCGSFVGGIAGNVTTSSNLSYARSSMSVIATNSSTSVNIGGLSGSHVGGVISQSFFAGSIRHNCASSCTGVGEIRGGGSATASETWSPGFSLIGTGGVNGNSTAGTANHYSVNAYGLSESVLCPTSTCDDNVATKWTFFTGGLPRLGFEESACESNLNLTSLSAQQAQGRGSALNPYILCNFNQLNDLDGFSGHARFEEDIYALAEALDSSTINLSINLNGNGRFLFGGRLTSGNFAVFNSIQSGAVVRDLHLIDFYVGNAAATDSAVLTYLNQGTINNVLVSASKVIADDSAALLVVTNDTSGIINRANVEGVVYSDFGDIAGIAVDNQGEILNSTSLSALWVSNTATGTVSKALGGIAATSSGSIEKSVFEGSITAVGNGSFALSQGLGGIVGYNAGDVTNCLVGGDVTMLVTEESNVNAGGLVGVNTSVATVTYSMNLGLLVNNYSTPNGDQKTLVGQNAGTLTALMAIYPALYQVSGGMTSAATSQVANDCVGPANTLDSNLPDGSYYFKTDQAPQYYPATESGTAALSYVKGDDSCAGGGVQYNMYGLISESFTSPTSAALNTAGYSFRDMSNNSHAIDIKNAYVSHYTTGSLTTPATWIWENGKPDLFRFDK